MRCFAIIGLALFSISAIASPPYTLTWSDKRPMGMDVMGSRTAGSSITNPRGWFDDPARDYVSDLSHMYQFGTDILARADTEIQVLNSIHAQGVILWNIEGAETHKTYIGDPRLMPQLAPEMEFIADALFAKYTNAGFRVGLTVRAQTVGVGTTLPSATNGQVFIKTDAPYGSKEYYYTNGWTLDANHDQEKHADSFYPELLSKIEYAMNRWGCTLFYSDSYGIDSTYKDNALIWIMTNHPDILILPEATSAALQETNYFAMSAPYMLPVWTGYTVPNDIKALYPQSWGVIQITTPYSDYQSVLVSLRLGNVLIGNSWYSNTGNYIIKTAWENRGISPTLNIGTLNLPH